MRRTKLSKMYGVILLHSVLACFLLWSSVAATEMEVDGMVEADPEDSVTLLDNKKYFLPAEEWQTLHSDETVFAGLHYRINMATGLKEAKLMEGDDGTEYYSLLKQWLKNTKDGKNPNGGFKTTKQVKKPRVPVTEKNSSLNAKSEDAGFGLAIVPTAEGELKDHSVHKTARKLQSANSETENSNPSSFFEDLRGLDDSHLSFDEKVETVVEETKKNTSPEKPQQFRSYQQLKDDLAELELLLDSETNIVKNLITKQQQLATDEQRETNLQDIEYLLHKIDNAQSFIDNDGVRLVVVPSLNSRSPSVRALACKIITACVQNFPKGQIATYEAGVMKQLLSLLQHDKVALKTAALSSLSSLVRHFPMIQKELFTMTTTMPVLHSLLTHHDDKLRSKSLNFVSDLLMERKGVDPSTDGDRLSQLASVGMEVALLGHMDWCPHLVDSLRLAHRQYREVVNKVDTEERYLSEQKLDDVMQALVASDSLCAGDLIHALPTLQRVGSDYIKASRLNRDRDADISEFYQEKADDVAHVYYNINSKANESKLEL